VARIAASFGLFGPLLLLFSIGSIHGQERSAAIQVLVDRVDVGVIVTDPRGRFVEGLTRSDFHVFDNGVEQPLTNFAAVDQPASVLLTLEAGPAVYLLEGGHLGAAYALLQHLAPADRLALATYSESLTPILNFTTDKQLAMSALGELHFNLGFGSLNLSSSLLDALAALERLPEKKALVLLSSGFDTSPASASGFLLEKLRTSGVRVFTVSLNGELRSPVAEKSSKGTNGKGKRPLSDKARYTEQQFQSADALLAQLAAATGGQAFFPQSPAEFREAYAQIAELVRHEYSLAFTPPQSDGKVHSITVAIEPAQRPASEAGHDRVDWRVAHRQAYLAPLE
jgi:Ca-activated chloride channel homolog